MSDNGSDYDFQYSDAEKDDEGSGSDEYHYDDDDDNDEEEEEGGNSNNNSDGSGDEDDNKTKGGKAGPTHSAKGGSSASSAPKVLSLETRYYNAKGKDLDLPIRKSCTQPMTQHTHPPY